MSLTDVNGYSIGTSGSGATRRLLVDTGATSTGPTVVESTVFPVASSSLSTVGNTLVVDVSKAASAVAHVTGTFAGANATFEGSIDGTNWFLLLGSRTSTLTSESVTGVLAAAPTYGWKFNVAGLTSFRVRLTAITTGPQVWKVGLSADAIEPAPVIPTHAVTITGSATTTPVTPTAYSLVTTASTNSALIVGVAASLFELSISNPTATAASVKLYNKATAPTVGTDIPVLTVTIAAGATQVLNFGFTGKRFATGLGIAVTALPIATDTGVAVAGIQIHGSRI